MSLLQEIISEAVARDADVPRLLRLCMLLASRLKHEPLREWARRELDGYPNDVPLPPYRVLRVRNQGNFSGDWQGTLEIPLRVLPEKTREFYRNAHVRDSLAECANLVSGARAESSRLKIPWPIELAVKYGSKVANGAQCTSAWMEVSISEMVGLVDRVKTRVLDFAMEIEAADPNAGEVKGPGSVVLREEQVTQIFNTTINGGTVQNIAMGSAGATQAAINGIQPGDIASLLGALSNLGVDPAATASLATALEVDRNAGSKGMGAKAKEWLADLAIKASQKATEKGAETLAVSAAKAITAFIGGAAG